ncbi:MAG TPA: PEP-CTERM sorting domain-containing protein [Lacipirellula sp.]
MRKYFTPFVMAAAMCGAHHAIAAPVLQPDDFVIGIDVGPPVSFSNHPAAEGPLNAVDGNSATKYLNFGEVETGLMVTPFLGSTTVQSMVLTTANDHSARDPFNWELWGTNDFIDHAAPGVNNGTSLIPGVTWTQIASGDANLPGSLPGGGQFLPAPAPPNTPNPANDGRFMEGPVYSFSNTNAYSSYRIVFPTTKDPMAGNSMQIAEVQLYPSLDGPNSSAGVLSILDSASAFQLPQPKIPVNEGVANAIDGTSPRPDLPSQSNYPGNEAPPNVVDGTLAKYLNFAGDNSGFIVTPASGSSTLRSFQITTANDAVDRDPTSYELYGTNEAIASTNNSYGTAENWTLISSGAIALPTDRNTLGPVIPVTNEASYTSYKMLFPTRVGPGGLMQIAEASFYSTSDGMGADILNAGDPVLGIDATVRTGLVTKYLSFGEENSGLIVTPQAGPTTVTSLQITTANDFVERDPASYEIYGTNDPITSTEESEGTEENWTLISSGALALPEARLTNGDVITFANNTAYSSYKIVFPTVKDAPNESNSMQISGIQLFDDSAAADPDFDGDGDVDGRDFLVWQRNLGATGQAANDNGDANLSGTVDAADLAAWKAGYSGSAAAVAGVVPEPAGAAIALAGLGLAAIGGRRLRKRD